MAKAECFIALDNRGTSFARRLAPKLPANVPRKWLSILPAGTAATGDCTLEVVVEAEPVETRATFRTGKEAFFRFLADRFHAGVLEQGGPCRSAATISSGCSTNPWARHCPSNWRS